MKDNIWFTYKARIKAHERLEWLDFHSQSLLVWYAIISAIFAIIVIRYPEMLGENTDIFSAVLAVILLAISLSVTNRDFRGRAMLMRKNYLDLQKLYSSLSSNELSAVAVLDLYSELLADCENHKRIDDILARVGADGLTSRKPALKENALGYGWILGRLLVTAGLYILPIALVVSFAGCWR